MDFGEYQDRHRANRLAARQFDAYEPPIPWPLRGFLAALVTLGLVTAIEFGNSLVGCSVKGNIDLRNNQRVYTVPGNEHYWERRINLLAGERWFCSEESARAAGWRRAMQ